MEDLTATRDALPADVSPSAGMERLARAVIRRRLRQLCWGRVELCEGRRRECFGRASVAEDLSASIRVLDARFYGEVAFGGSIGAGEAYMLGYWTCDDLTRLVQILLRNRGVLDGLDSGPARLSRPLRRVLHWINRNTRRGSRRNVASHYDLGNDFFALWLDRRMMYSSAFFEQPHMSLEEASVAKLERICRKLELGPADRVVEIGTGWGGFAIYAAQTYGCHVTTTTISRQQYVYARERVLAHGLEDRVTVLSDDYRDLRGQYDKLVSIEMVEAVGHRFQPLFFRKCAELLKPGGRMLLQSITIADQEYERSRRSVDFIQRHIFPGGCLTSVTSMLAHLTAHTDLRAASIEDFGASYAETLRRWRSRIFGRLEDVRRLGYSDEFIRMWHYYLCYCEGAFLESATGVVHMLLVRPRYLRAGDGC